jgi:hypothetical protein
MEIGILVLAILLVILGLAIRPIRKAVGLVLVVLGILASTTGIGLILGISMILVGGVLLFA